jgi:DNA polymerase III subunit alpha
MKKSNIKPILGCELYICKQDVKNKDKENKKLSHFIVLAKNYEGWKKLIKIVSESNKPDNYYHKPRLDLNTLKSICDENLISIVGHLGSTLADEILEDNKLKEDWLQLGVDHVNLLKNIFSGNVFLESQLIDSENLPIQKTLTEAIRDIGKKTNTLVICTPDAHYCRREDAIDQRILLCNNLKTTFPEISRKISNEENVPMGCFFVSDNYHIPSQEEMKNIHSEEEIKNTIIVSDMIEEYDILSKPRLPKFSCPEKYTEDEYLRELCRVGWKNKIANKINKEDQQKYVDRIKYELDVLQGAGLSSYFLIVQDIVEYIRKNNWLPGPGRGCFLPDTRVKMSNGLMKNIRDVKIGDYVIDCESNKQRVYETLVYDIDEDIVELWFGDIVIRCTKDHKFLTTNRGWVEAQYLTEEDDIKEV